MDSFNSCPSDRPPAPPPRSASVSSRSVARTKDHSPLPRVPSRSPPPLDSSIEDIEVDDLGALEEDLLDDDLLVVPQAKHFLDYDSQPPPGFDETVIGPNITSHPISSAVNIRPNASRSHDSDEPDDVDDVSSTVAVKGVPNSSVVYPGEVRKVDKKYETDGEISDFELANYSHSMRARRAEKAQNSNEDVGAVRKPKKKHFLDENPIPPDASDFDREHRSLDRNYERAKELDPTKSTDRKYSLQPQPSGRRKESTSFALARFLEHDSVGPTSLPPPIVHRGTWPADRPNDTHIGHMTGGVSMPGSQTADASSIDGEPSASRSQMGPKVECVYSLLSMLGCSDQVKMSRKFLELSRSPDTCASLRHSRCIPLIVQIIHSDADEQTRKDASAALHNVVNCHPDDKAGRREAKVLRHIEHVLEYSESLKQMLCDGEALADDRDRHPLQAMSSLMKISFDEEHRHAMCQLGALQAIASVVQYDHAMHGNVSIDERCVSLRRYSAMALTNLTFGDGYNKAALCANKEFMRAFVAQLNSNVDDLLPVTANVLRNLSWRADNTMKQVLNEIGTVTALTKAVMRNQNESTIKALLSALWNLSAHCSTNKAEFCTVDGALAFLVDMLQYEGPSKSLTIIENAGGILRNVSSHIAVNESYRAILRQRNCLGILLQQLSSESLTIVSNACGTLWNLSARCAQDQQFLLDNNAVRRLSLLLPSKHKMISNGSSAALKNLMNFQPSAITHSTLDPVAKAMRLKELPTLNVRKQRAFEQALDQNLGETCDNIEITTPPKENHKSMDDFLKLHPNRQQYTNQRLTKSATTSMPRSESKDSIVSVIRIGLSKPSSTPPTPRRSIAKPIQDPSTSNAHPVSNGPYQETDLDQITDFSLRYGELPIGDYSDSEEIPTKAGPSKPSNTLALDDSVKCYETEGTPYVISNAASVTDLSRGIKVMSVTEPTKKFSTRLGAIENSGINTPERCTNYCEEGTPGVYDSYSSLDEGEDADADHPTKSLVVVEEEPMGKPHPEEEDVPIAYQHPDEEDEDEERDHVSKSLVESECGTNAPTTPGGSVGQKAVTFETPMMFSRHSSMESLSSIEPALAMDDRSSVVSDFSRLASGIISPSEIPDSPSQMVAHSPRRSSGGAAVSFFPTTPPTHFQQQQQPLRSVFEDDVNMFGVENTPAQFSCATSLSNLSLDDEPKIASDSRTKEPKCAVADQSTRTSNDDRRGIGGTTSEDSDDDGDADTDLLATCINIGMNKTPVVESVKPDLISQIQIPNQLDDSTSGSDVADDSLLEQCIREGIQRTVVKPTQTPIDQPPIPGPKPVKQQHNDSLSSLSMDSEDDGAILRQAIAAGAQKIIKQAPLKPSNPNFQSIVAEDSFSSIDSIDSGDTQNATSILEHCIQTGMHKKDPPPMLLPATNKPKLPERSSSSPKRSQLPLFKSPSQVERDRLRERDRKDEALFMECIQTGMAKPRSIPAPQAHTSNYRRDLLLSAHQTSASHNEASHSNQFPQPPMAMPKNVQTTSVAVPLDTHDVPCTAPGVDETTHFQLYPNSINNHTNHQSPNNITTPSLTIPLVVDKSGSRSDQSFPTPHPAPVDHRTIRSGSSYMQHLTTSHLDQSLASISDFSQALDRSNEFPAMMVSNDTVDTEFPKIDTSTMEQSNEFLMEDHEDCDEFAAGEDLSDEEFVSEVARELQEPSQSSNVTDKHKDPDLMMQSVDRLTQQLMSTAEKLRTASSNDDVEPTVYERKSSSTNTWNEDTCPNEVSFPSISWTAPNIAYDDDEDATISKEKPYPTIDSRSFILDHSDQLIEEDDFILGTSQPESLEADTATLVSGTTHIDNQIDSISSGIRFHVGGPTFRDHRVHNPSTASSAFHLGAAVSGRSFTCANPMSTSSDMTNSTIIALEASKLTSDLLNMQHMTDSTCSLDLDAIRPPSGMDMVSGYFEPSISSTVGPMYSPQLARRKKSLPAGLVAKRALNQFTSGITGSMESVHSSYNLENVKPPSIMDELLDSMISVASITSEVASPNHSHYDTAMSQMLVHDDEDEDDTTTLRSCYDLPQDKDQATPVASDFSSAESTPRKQRCVRRALTAKQKRLAAKERYRTYTIAADMMFLDSDAPSDEGSAIDAVPNGVDSRRQPGDGADQESHTNTNMVQIEIGEERTRLMTPRQRRSEDRSRFQTQIIDPSHFADLHSSGDSSAPPRQRLQTFSSQEDENDDGFSATRTPSAFQKFNTAVIDTTSSGSNSLDDDADMSSIRALTERFRFISEELPTPQPAPSSLPSVARKLAVLTQQRLHIAEPITEAANSLDFEQTSETESCHQNNCIDEETYNVPDTSVKQVLVEPKVLVKPKIVKPSLVVEQKSQQDEDMEPKAIRGKKKAAYVSPYRKSVTTSPPAKKTIQATPTPMPPKRNISKLLTPRGPQANIVTKTHVLTNKSSLTTKPTVVKTGLAKPGFSSTPKTPTDKLKVKMSIDKVGPKTSTTNARLATPKTKVAASRLAPPVMPERQGTFVKDEPTHADVPVVASAPSTPAKTSRLPSKLPSASSPSPTKTSNISRLKNPLQRSASIGNAKISTPKVQPLAGRPSNQSQTDLNKRRTAPAGGFYRSPSTPSVPMRSQSNVSLKSNGTATPNSSQPPSRSNSNLSKNGISTGISSRISSLWKKQPDAGKTTAPSKVGTSSPMSGKPPVGRLIRSSTFDNTPEEEDGHQLEEPEVVLRVKTIRTDAADTAPKRISRLGTFINMEETAA